MYCQQILEAGQILRRHRGVRRWGRVRCAVGCGRWPCPMFIDAVGVLVRSASALEQTRAAQPPFGHP